MSAPASVPSFDAESEGATRRVGQPTHELLLMAVLISDVWRLYRPGAGRSAFVIFEPEVGAGRPDMLIVTVSVAALERFRRTGLRVPTPSATRALSDSDESALGLSTKYVRTLRKHLEQSGWLPREFDRGASIVHDSLTVEAKIRDWRQALRQVAKFRVTSHRSAIFMPEAAANRIPLTVLGNYGTGLISESRGRAKWVVPSVRHNLSDSSRLWLLEVLIRALESGTAYKPSDLRKLARDRSRDSTLGR